MFNQHTTASLGLAYDPTKSITYVPDAVEFLEEPIARNRSVGTDKIKSILKFPLFANAYFLNNYLIL